MGQNRFDELFYTIFGPKDHKHYIIFSTVVKCSREWQYNEEYLTCVILEGVISAILIKKTTFLGMR